MNKYHKNPGGGGAHLETGTSTNWQVRGMGKVAVHTGGGGGGELPYVVGTYRGSGSTAGTHIQLGFMPTAVLIENERGLRGWADRPSENVGGLLLRDRIIGDAGNAAARVTETGFFVITSLDRIDRYCYIAFR